jgi:hypothetical protein
MLNSTALLLDSDIRNSVCTPAKLPCRRVVEGSVYLKTNKVLRKFQQKPNLWQLYTFFLMEAIKHLLAKINMQPVTAVTVTTRLLTLSLDIWEIGKYVKFPRTPKEIITIQSGYFKNYNFPEVID